MIIRELVRAAGENSRRKGFRLGENLIQKYGMEDNADDWMTVNNLEIGTMLGLVMSEGGEALEAYRKEDYENYAEELADIVIRVADLAYRTGVDLQQEIETKMEKNAGRPTLHGKRF